LRTIGKADTILLNIIDTGRVKDVQQKPDARDEVLEINKVPASQAAGSNSKGSKHQH
jgi:hypothetical protein